MPDYLVYFCIKICYQEDEKMTNLVTLKAGKQLFLNGDVIKILPPTK